MTRFFIAGIIQGSIDGHTIHPQDYRGRIKRAILAHVPEAEVYCPIENHPDSLEYDDARARGVFFAHVAQGAEADVMVAFLPEASMGTAVEMWEAHKRGVLVIGISPMVENWAVKFLSDRIVRDLDAFEAFVAGGELAGMIADRAENN